LTVTDGHATIRLEGAMIETAELGRMSLFKDLSTEELERIKHLMFERSFKPGSTLFLEGMQGEVLYIVRQGRIEILKKKGETDFLIATLGPGDFVGEMSIIDAEPRSATARVAEESTLLVVTRKCFLDIMQTIPGAANKILLTMLKVVNQRLRETNRKLASA
jgi:CRP-like cAMP-binding protein